MNYTNFKSQKLKSSQHIPTFDTKFHLNYDIVFKTMIINSFSLFANKQYTTLSLEKHYKVPLSM